MASKIREYFSTSYLPGERLLLQKLDFFILTFCCICYFINYVSLHPFTQCHSASPWPPRSAADRPRSSTAPT